MAELGTFTPDNLISGEKPTLGEDIVVPSGSPVRGTVMGRIKQSTPTTGTADGGNTGDGTVTAVTGGPDTKKGDYLIECITAEANGGTFQVSNPDGDILGQVKIQAGAGASADFKSKELNFTVTDGATDFAAGDKFTVAVTDGVPSTGTADGGNTGDGTVTEVEGRRSLKVGTYEVECTAAAANSGTFKVTDPDGVVIESALTIPAGAGNSISFSNDQLAGKITDGATDFAVGDKFTIVVSIAPRQVVPCDKTATDGSSVPYCVLSEDLDASSSAQRGIGYIEGAFNERALIFATGTDVEDVRDVMRDLGMLVVPSTAYPA